MVWRLHGNEWEGGFQAKELESEDTDLESEDVESHVACKGAVVDYFQSACYNVICEVQELVQGLTTP